MRLRRPIPGSLFTPVRPCSTTSFAHSDAALELEIATVDEHVARWSCRQHRARSQPWRCRCPTACPRRRVTA